MITPQQIQVYSGVRMKVEVELDRFKLSVQDLLSLRVGGLIPLTKALGENLTLRVGGTEVGEGEIVLLDQKMGLRIAKLTGAHPVQTKKGT